MATQHLHIGQWLTPPQRQRPPETLAGARRVTYVQCAPRLVSQLTAVYQIKCGALEAQPVPIAHRLQDIPAISGRVEHGPQPAYVGVHHGHGSLWRLGLPQRVNDRTQSDHFAGTQSKQPKYGPPPGAAE
ncbi:MAG TPA: hypothetical protein VGS19_31270 [Streptosporangiaceae bacterium]|nr:hypothetical protein [Streptosporangiaceae bacterium]